MVVSWAGAGSRAEAVGPLRLVSARDAWFVIIA
jgi:hypothetical protein